VNVWKGKGPSHFGSISLRPGKGKETDKRQTWTNFSVEKKKISPLTLFAFPTAKVG